MFKPSLPERIEHNVNLILDSLLNERRKKLLNNIDFTIISNNCWGGIAYQYYGLQKLSPTVGTYFYSDDYIKFISNINYYLSMEIEMIDYKRSAHSNYLIKRGEMQVPIGRIDDVEIVFLHYTDNSTAYEAWNRRKERVNMNNLIFKFSEMNLCAKEHLKCFDTLKLPGKKFMFVNNNSHEYACGIYYKGFEQDDQIENDTYFWNKYFDVTEFINTGKIICKY